LARPATAIYIRAPVGVTCSQGSGHPLLQPLLCQATDMPSHTVTKRLAHMQRSSMPSAGCHLQDGMHANVLQSASSRCQQLSRHTCRHTLYARSPHGKDSSISIAVRSSRPSHPLVAADGSDHVSGGGREAVCWQNRPTNAQVPPFR
jgi:hypothetical protein